MDKKKILFIVGVVLIIILGIIALNISKNKTKTSPALDNLNENILKDTNYAGLKIADQSVITREGLSTYMANVTNTKDTDNHIDKLYVVFTVNGEVIEVLAIADTTLGANDTIPLTIEFDQDISNTTKVEFKSEGSGEVIN